MSSRTKDGVSASAGTSRRRFVAGCLGAIGVAALAGRIWWVNANAFEYPETHHTMGEWIDLDGAFLSYANEATTGYSVSVQDARVMSRREYIERYALAPSQVERTEHDDIESVLCLSLGMKNKGSTAGGFLLTEAKLVPEGAIRAMRYQTDLWATSNKTIDESTGYISLLEDTEFTTHIPYLLYASNEEDYLNEVTCCRLSFTVSNAPVRNIIDIELA